MIIYSIIVTALLMTALVCTLYEHVGRINAEERANGLNDALLRSEEIIHSYEVEKANRDGVDAGMSADKMFRQFLDKFERHEQVTVLLNRPNAKYYAEK